MQLFANFRIRSFRIKVEIHLFATTTKKNYTRKFKNNVLQFKITKTMDHQQHIISLNDLQNLEKSLCIWDKAKNKYWKSIMLGT